MPHMRAPMSPRRSTLSRAVVIALLSVGVLFGCEKGPGQQTGEKVDKAIDTLSGKGPVEKAGERVDKAVKEIKK
jgi:hypothetical protein